MKRRHAARLAARVWAKAELCGVALSDWTALPRAQRKKRIRKAKKKGGDRGRTNP